MSTADAPHVPTIPPPRFFFAVASVAALFFGVWTCFVFGSDLPVFDLRCAEYCRDWNDKHHGPWDLMVFCTDLGGIAAMTLLTIMGAIWQTAIRHRTLAVAWLAIVIGGALLMQGCKEAIGRARPSEALRDRAIFHENPSYPSGHAMMSTVGFGLLAYALVLPQRHRPRRVVAVNLMIAIVLVIGFSRVYLRAHWFSDVIGGFSLGLAWLFLCLGWLERRRLRLRAGSHQPSAVSQAENSA